MDERRSSWWRTSKGGCRVERGQLGNGSRLLEQLADDPESLGVTERPEQIGRRGELICVPREHGAGSLEGGAWPEWQPLAGRVAGLEERLADRGPAASPGDDNVEAGDDEERDHRIHPAGLEPETEKAPQSDQAGGDTGDHADVENGRDHHAHRPRHPHQAGP